MLPRLALAIMMLACLPLQAADLFPALFRTVPSLQKVGEADYSVLFLDVYKIALFAPEGRYTQTKPRALSVLYHVAIDGTDIVDRSVDEMRRQGIAPSTLAAWKEEMLSFMPDVNAGTRLAVLDLPGRETRFYKDGKQIGTVRAPGFGDAYLGIWLSRHTSEPAMRAALLGES